jgi:hypothetical protein
MRFPREVHSPNQACLLSTSLRRWKNDKRYRDVPKGEMKVVACCGSAKEGWAKSELAWAART